MKHFAKLAACLATLCTLLVCAQASTQDGTAVRSTTSTSAYVYVISNPSTTNVQLDGYSAASDGTLTLLPGSPFWTSSKSYAQGLAGTTHWLFVSDGTYIYSFSIGSTGTLKQVSSINAAQYSSGDPITAGLYLMFDHTGSTLYALGMDSSGNEEYQFFDKNSATGALTYFGVSNQETNYNSLSFTGNNEYAYGFSCAQAETFGDSVIRSSDGGLTQFFPSEPIPSYPNGQYCLGGVAADPGSDLAIAMYPGPIDGSPEPPAALGVYTVDGSGNLSTNSTYETMPTSEVGWINDMEANPAGNLLAVGGASGLQVFFFNGSKQITPYTGFLAEHFMTQLAWDNSNHLYGISFYNRLYSFTVTTTGYHQDTDSPYTISVPRSITVVSK
jgi:hypothetical protein